MFEKFAYTATTSLLLGMKINLKQILIQMSDFK